MNPKTCLPYPDTLTIAREWWLVTKPEGPLELYCCPPRTKAEVEAMYPHCGVAEMAE